MIDGFSKEFLTGRIGDEAVCEVGTFFPIDGGSPVDEVDLFMGEGDLTKRTVIGSEVKIAADERVGVGGDEEEILAFVNTIDETVKIGGTGEGGGVGWGEGDGDDFFGFEGRDGIDEVVDVGRGAGVWRGKSWSGVGVLSGIGVLRDGGSGDDLIISELGEGGFESSFGGIEDGVTDESEIGAVSRDGCERRGATGAIFASGIIVVNVTIVEFI